MDLVTQVPIIGFNTSSYSLTEMGDLASFLRYKGSDNRYLLLREDSNMGDYYVSIPSYLDPSLVWIEKEMLMLMGFGEDYSPEEFNCDGIKLVIKKNDITSTLRDIYCADLYNRIFGDLSTAAIAGKLANDTKFAENPAVVCSEFSGGLHCEEYKSLNSLKTLSKAVLTQIGLYYQSICPIIDKVQNKIYAVVFDSTKGKYGDLCESIQHYIGWGS